MRCISNIVRTAIILLAAVTYLRAQTMIDPATQINWTAITGSGAPTSGCPTIVNATLTSGSAIATVSSAAGLLPYQAITGTGIPSGTSVSFVFGNRLTMNQNATVSGVESLSFFSYGLNYTDVTNNVQYVCGASGWFHGGGGGSGTIDFGDQYSPVYYVSNPTGNTVGGVTPFTGIGFWSTDEPPAAASSGQVLAAIGTGNIANSYLANEGTTVNGQNCVLGSPCTVTANVPNSLTANNSGSGASSGSTFNGSAPLTLSYNTIGAPGLSAANSYSGTLNDFSGTSQIKLPVAVGYASAANGEIGYDTTNQNWHIYRNAADSILAAFLANATITNGDCVQWLQSSNSVYLGDAGSPCGSGGGGGSGAPNQQVSFTSATSASLTVTSSTQNITWSCWDNSSPVNDVYPSNVSLNTSTYLVTFTFVSPQSGYCVVNSTGSGAYASTESGSTWSVPETTHNMGSNVLVSTYDSNGNQIFGNVAVDTSGDVTVSWLTSQTGKVVIVP